jgi:2-phosphosulfolactate phosphatase
VLAGCLRNASATAMSRRLAGSRPMVAPSVIAAGERWHGATARSDPPSRTCSAPARCSLRSTRRRRSRRRAARRRPRAARAAFVAARPLLHDAVAGASSGRELLARGWDDDVANSAALDVTDHAAHLVDDAFVRA